MSRVARFDLGSIAKAERDGETLRCYFRFRKVGPLTYRHADGSEHIEHVLDEHLFSAASLRTAAMRPITRHHPDEGMVTRKNARQYQRGLSGNTIIRDDPYAVIVGAVTDEELQDAILAKELDQISSGYWAKTLLDSLQRYIQTEVEYNHFAATNRGRAGPDVGFLGISNDAVKSLTDCAYQCLSRADEHELFNKPLIWTPNSIVSLDSLDSSTKAKGKKMTTKILKTIKIDESRTIEVGDSPDAQALGSVLSEVVKERNTLQGKVDSLATVEAKVKTLESELATAKARADVAEAKGSEPDADGLKKSFDEGYKSGQARHALEQEAQRILPATVKVDSLLSDRQIKEACILQLLGLKADSPKAKTYSDMGDEALGVAYQVILDSKPISTVPPKPPNGNAPNTPPNLPPNLDAADLAWNEYVERLKNGGKKKEKTMA